MSKKEELFEIKERLVLIKEQLDEIRTALEAAALGDSNDVQQKS